MTVDLDMSSKVKVSESPVVLEVPGRPASDLATVLEQDRGSSLCRLVHTRGHAELEVDPGPPQGCGGRDLSGQLPLIVATESGGE